MSKHCLLSGRRNVICIVAVLLGLLSEQWALAAHACASPAAMTGCPMAMPQSAPHAAMSANAQPRQSATDRLWCIGHCAAQASAPSDAHPLTAPPSLRVTLPLTVAQDPPRRSAIAAAETRYRLRAPPRPRSLLFCSLLI